MDWDNSQYQNQIIVLIISANWKSTWHCMWLLNKNKIWIENGIRIFYHTKCMTISKTIIILFLHTICFGPLWLVFEIKSRNIQINKTLTFVHYDETAVLDIRGLIYYGDFHFTCCIVRNDGNVWYCDGISTGSAAKWRWYWEVLKQKIQRCRGKQLVFVVCARV